MKTINTLPPFKRFCVTIGNLPSSYVDSMSYYECLMWLCKYLKDTVIPAINENAEAVNELINWFNNLDVQDEIDHKLDEMVESGKLQEIISEYLNSTAVFGFDTVADMKKATNLINGSYAKTLGFNSLNDKGGASYKIRTVTNEDTVNEMDLIALNDVTLVAELIDDKKEINPAQYGAILDGVTDDTDIIEYCLTLGNVKLPSKSNVCINDLEMVEYRTLDFNGSEVNCSGTAIKVGSSTASNYTRNCIIKNGNFNNSESSSTTNDIKIIYLSQSIRCELDNITASHINEGCVGIYISNSFNIKIDGVYLGNGNQSQTSKSAGIIVIAETPSIEGTNNLTNISINHGLIQNVDGAIQYKINNGSIDTSVINDIGVSNCNNGYVFEGNSNTVKNIMVSNSRVESTNIGIYNFANLTLNNVNINFLNKTNAMGIFNRSSGRLTVLGYIGFIGTSISINNQGWADFKCSYPSLNPATAPANLQVPIERPLHVESSTHSGTDFSSYVHPFYDYQFVQTDSFEITDLPNAQNGTKLIILYNGKTYVAIKQNNTWYMN